MGLSRHFLIAAGFVLTASGYLIRQIAHSSRAPQPRLEEDEPEEDA